MTVVEQSVLSPREHELLRLFAEGHTCVTAARVLGTSPHTTRTQLRAIRLKLNACAKDHAIEIARRKGIL